MSLARALTWAFVPVLLTLPGSPSHARAAPGIGPTTLALTWVRCELAACATEASAARIEQEAQGAGTAPQAPPKEARDAFERAAKAAKSNKPDEARRGYERAVALYPGYAEAWCELGKLQMARNDVDEARNSLQAAIKAKPAFAEPYKILVVLENKLGNWKQLADLTDRLLKLDPAEYWQAYVFNAVANQNLQQPEAAEKSAWEAERLDTDHKFPVTWQILGGLLARRGDFAGAAAQYRMYLQLKPAGPESDAVRLKLAGLEKRANAEAGPGPAAAAFRTETDLVLVRFQVIPQKGQFVADLRQEDIEIREDGVPQKISVFEGGRFYPRSIPLEITLLFDCSGSVQQAGTLDPHVFDDSLLNEYKNARIAIYGFSDSLVRLTRPTRDGTALMKAMDGVRGVPSGGTPLFQSIAETARDAASAGANSTRMIVVFSDGESTKPGDSDRSAEAARVAQDLGIALCPVMLPHFSEAVQETSWAFHVADSQQRFLNLAPATGGQRFEALASRDVLPAILKAIANHVRYDYVAGFYPASSGGGQRHNIEVVLKSRERGRIIGGSRHLVH